jgi:hypothetical protein
MLRLQLACRPSHRLSPLFRSSAVPIRLYPSHLRKHLAVAVPVKELPRNIEAQQTRDCFDRHGTWKHIATDNYKIHFFFMYILEHRLKRGKVSMNIIDCSDSHEDVLFLAAAKINRSE